MAAVHRSSPMENKQLMSLYRGENKLSTAGCEERCADSEEAKGKGSIRSSVSLEIYGLQREQKEQQVLVSNQEYYRRLEELKSTHLRNIAELERLYISQAVDRYNREGEGLQRSPSRRLFSDGPVRRLQRINSQEELDFHEDSSPDPSETRAEERTEEHMEKTQSPATECTFGRLILSPEEPKKQKPFRFQPRNARPRVLGLSAVKAKAKSKVTIPKPFHMMLREEERKRHQVRSRSQVELENCLLKRELEELRECRKQFRATPAPAHIHLPLYDALSHRFSQRPPVLGHCSPACPPRQFEFLERERRKREARIEAELGSLCPRRDEARQFKARPMPRSVYGPKYKAQSVSTEREDTEGHSDPSSDLETETLRENTEGQRSKCLLAKAVKKQIEVSIEMVKEKPWSYIDPIRSSGCNRCSPLHTEKSGYISV